MRVHLAIGVAVTVAVVGSAMAKVMRFDLFDVIYGGQQSIVKQRMLWCNDRDAHVEVELKVVSLGVGCGGVVGAST